MKDGNGTSATFFQATGICTEFDLLLLADVQMPTIRLVMSAGGMTKYLAHPGMLYTAFNVHLRHGHAQNESLESATDINGRMVTYMEATVHRAKEMQRINQTSVSNGQQGTISANTVNSLKMIRAELSYISVKS